MQKTFLNAILVVLLGLVLSGCGNAGTRGPQASPRSTSSSAPSPVSCEQFYEAKAFDACRAGKLDEAKQLEAAYESGTGSYSPPPAPKYGIGDTVESGGAVLTLTGFQRVDSIAMNNSSFRQGSGYDSYEDRAPGAGSALYRLDAAVQNNTKDAMDLTCSLGVNIHLLSSQDEKYGPIEGLYKIKGNPECNYFMQPGYSENMTWVFQAPSDRKIIGAYFTASLDTHSSPGVFTLDKNYTLSDVSSR